MAVPTAMQSGVAVWLRIGIIRIYDQRLVAAPGPASPIVAARHCCQRTKKRHGNVKSKTAKAPLPHARVSRKANPAPTAKTAERLDSLLATGDVSAFFEVLGEHARSTLGIAQLADRTQLNRTALYEALSRTGNPRLRSVSAILAELGLRLSIQRRR